MVCYLYHSYSKKGKILGPLPVYCTDMGTVGHIQMMLPANCWKDICLAQDTAQADFFYYILSKQNLEKDLSIDTAFDPC